jgi:hypothetical protein
MYIYQKVIPFRMYNHLRKINFFEILLHLDIAAGICTILQGINTHSQVYHGIVQKL